MALTATVFHFQIDLSDMDRGVFEHLDLRVAQHPSETAEFMLTRVLAYCLEYQPGIALTAGIGSGDDPAILVKDAAGRTTAWIEVGLPDPARLHRGIKLAGRAAVYSHRDVRQLIGQLTAFGIHRAESVPVYAIDREFIADVASVLERRMEFALSVSDRELYLTTVKQSFTGPVTEHRIEDL